MGNCGEAELSRCHSEINATPGEGVEESGDGK